METQVPAEDAPVPADETTEDRLRAIEQRLDALEASIRDAITQELAGVGEEMRRAVSELGRLLLRDLDRLTKVLADHRDAIVERLRPGPPESPEPAPEPSAAPARALKGEEGRWWAFPARRRRTRP